MMADVAPHRVQWQQIPIPVVLSVGEERRVHFRAPVSVGIPASLQALLRTQTVNGTVYLLAHAPFAETRVLVRELDAGQTYLLDLRAGRDAGSVGPIYVEHRPNRDAALAAGSVQSPGTHSYVSLTRFAAQQLFAPLRLLSPLPGVARVPVQQKSVFLVPGDAVEATPLMAWRAGKLYLTAVKLRNRSGKAQVLDPRLLRGKWLTATFQHARLLPAGDVADSTAVYLISAQPFAASF
jgi:integrating conjugative element protein (TIGR03749 family)